MNQLIETNLDLDFSVIPFYEVMRLVNAFHKRPVPDNKEIAVLWLALGGGRPCEIWNRKTNEIILNRYWVWHPRKKQSGMRKENYPDWFWRIMDDYLKHGKYSADNLFGLSGNSLASYINHKIRPILGGRWLVKRPEFLKGGGYRLEYCYKLKALRHNYQTVMFNYFKEEFGPEVAISMVAKKMCHSDYRITARHYLASAKALELYKYPRMSMGDILVKCQNHNMLEYL